MADSGKKLYGSPDTFADSGAITNGTATATIAAPGAGKRVYVQQAIISAGGTVVAARATLAFTQGGSVKTIGVEVGGVGIWSLYFGQNPIECDDNTSVTLTIPGLGASGIGDASLIAFTAQV